ncbi:MAG: TlpA disulfide reductase family protein [Candidatus Omnitrophota bacterium]
MRRVPGLFLAFVAGFFLLASGCTAQNSRPAAGGGGISTFTLKDLGDQDVSFDTLLSENKVVLINFWATWCPPCREEIPDLIKLQEKYKNSGFTVLGVDVGESKAKVSRFAEKMGMNYPIVLDEDMEVARQYGIVGIPTTYLVSSDGRILGRYHAFTRKLAADVEKALQ